MARIIRQTTVVRDGWHNAFTDLIHWQGHFLVSYRKGGGHISRDGEAVVAVSPEGQRFREVARLKLNGDTRDPKLVAMSDDRLAMIFPTWVGGVRGDESTLQQYVSFSDNGWDWETPQAINDRDLWLWRVRKVGDKYYGLNYGWGDGGKNTGRRFQNLVVSDDMINWTTISQIGEDHMKLGEADLFVQDDGEMWVVSRSSEQGGLSYFSTAKAPYTEWKTTQLDCLIHAPIILKHKGRFYVSGRRNADVEKDATFPFLGRASLGVWRLERGKVEPLLRIPATGDCSYPGLIEHDGRVYMSYYSQHAYDMGVFDYTFKRESETPHSRGDRTPANDVYFAELELD